MTAASSISLASTWSGCPAFGVRSTTNPPSRGSSRRPPGCRRGRRGRRGPDQDGVGDVAVVLVLQLGAGDVLDRRTAALSTSLSQPISCTTCRSRTQLGECRPPIRPRRVRRTTVLSFFVGRLLPPRSARHQARPTAAGDRRNWGQMPSPWTGGPHSDFVGRVTRRARRCGRGHAGDQPRSCGVRGPRRRGADGGPVNGGTLTLTMRTSVTTST